MSVPPPTVREIPQLVIDRAPAPGLSSRLVAMVVHVVGARASAEVDLAGPWDPAVTRLDVGTTRLAIRLPSGSKLFSGKIAEVETRMGEDGATTTVQLHRGSRVRLLSEDAEVGGPFQVTELWNRFDVQRGLRVEFIATR